MSKEIKCTRTTTKRTVHYVEDEYHPDVNNRYFAVVAAQRGNAFGAGGSKRGRR